MRKKKAVQLAVNNLVHSKLRTWLTVIGIVIGVAAVVAIISIGEGLQYTVTSQLSGLGADIITITPGGGGGAASVFRGFGGGGIGETPGANLTRNDLQSLRTVGNLAVITGEVSGRVTIYYLGQTRSVSVAGVDPLPWSTITTDTLSSGRFLTSSDYNSVVLGYSIATQTFKEQVAINQMVQINNKSFKVVGILGQSGGFGDDNRIIMPFKAATDLLSLDTNNFDSIVVKASSSDAVTQLSSDLDSRLMLLHHIANVNRKDYTVTSAASIQSTLSSITGAITLFLGAIAAISLLVGGIGIANSMFTSVLEKTHEIGIMKAIGATNSDILSIFVLSSAMIGGVGGFIGIAVGAFGSILISGLNFTGSTASSSVSGVGGRGAFGAAGGSGFTTVITPELVIGAFMLAIAIGVVSGLIPSYRASKLKPVDALRYE